MYFNLFGQIFTDILIFALLWPEMNVDYKLRIYLLIILTASC